MQTNTLAVRLAAKHDISVTAASRILGEIASELDTGRPMEHWSGWDNAVAWLRAQATAGLIDPIPEKAKIATGRLLAAAIGLFALFAALLFFTL